jgi:hypothetical protein
MKSLRSKLTYANVMATVAVFIALGGASYAAVKLPKNSVGTRQIKNNAITAAKIKNGAVTGPKVKVGSLGTVPSAAHATNADSANHAASADTATTAGTAANAVALGGRPPAAFEKSGDLLGAVVSNNGTTAKFDRGTAGTTVERTAKGDVFVTFPRNISQCTWVTSTGHPADEPLTPQIAGARIADGNPDTVQVITTTPGSGQTD